jgi:hypothetical protein
MKRNGKAVLALGVLAAALIAAGGAAFTNSNSLPQTKTVGYGSSEISGATADSIVYHPSADGSTIDSVTIVLQAPGSLNYYDGRPTSPVYSIKGGFTHSGNPVVTDALTQCDVADKSVNLTNEVVCNFTELSTESATSFHLLVINNS